MSRFFKRFYIQAHAISDQGNVRTNNEDNFFIDGHVNPEPQSGGNMFLENMKLNDHVFAVCDGMGGESYGEVASAMAVESLNEYYSSIKKSKSIKLGMIIDKYANYVNNRICKMVEERNCYNSGTTLAMLCFKDDYAFPFYIGDSRIYLYDGFDLYALTKDQTLATEMLQHGVYTPEQAEISYDRNKLMHFLGEDKDGNGLKITAQSPIALRSGMKFLICSDGLSDMCSDLTLYEVFSDENEDDYAQRLIDLALEAGGSDNVTVIVIEIF